MPTHTPGTPFSISTTENSHKL